VTAVLTNDHLLRALAAQRHDALVADSRRRGFAAAAPRAGAVRRPRPLRRRPWIAVLAQR
jgi:hypothetical protein